MMKRQYVERFFATGELLVSSFDRFRRHADEEQKDKQEGWNLLVGRGSKRTMFFVAGHDKDAYILSGTSAKDVSLMERFGADAAIQIYDTTSFASVITRHLAGVKYGFEGFCSYIDGTVECNVGDSDLDQVKQLANGTNLDLSQLGGIIQNMASLAVYFRKAAKFRKQLEYRWVWISDHPVAEPAVIYIPDARQFCAPLYAEDVKEVADDSSV